MAHLPMLCEFRARLLTLRAALPLDCLLCRARAAGGLCRHCSAAVTASMVSARRCHRCALALPQPRPSAAFDGMVAEVLRSTAARLGMAPRPEWGVRQERSKSGSLVPTWAGPACAADAGTASGDGCFPCPDCRDLSPALKRVVAAFDYTWPGDLLIQRLKLQGRFSCAPVLADLLAARCHALQLQTQAQAQVPTRTRPQAQLPAPATSLCCGHSTLVTAVPAGSRSLALRGYNPAGEVGRALARRLGLEWRPGLILRSQDGRDQKHLGRRARRIGVQGLYRCPGGVAGREVLIVDDVMTTGATLSAIADTLNQQGATKVWAAVLARTPLIGVRPRLLR